MDMIDTPLLFGRRRFLALMAAPAVAAVLSGCSDESCESDALCTSLPEGDATTDVAFSDVARVEAAPELATPASRSVNAFGADLYGALATGDENIVFSPASIAIALAMLRAGAAGPTATEIDAVLHVDDPASLHRSMNALSAELGSRSTVVEIDGEQRPVTLSIANSLWGQTGRSFEPEYLDVLAAEYGAGINTVDMQADAEGSRRAINSWVSDQTAGRIAELLPAGSITPQTVLTLVNAIHLKASWLEQFEPAATADEPFTRLDGSAVDVPMMHGGGFRSAAQGDGWVAVDLPFVSGELGLLVVVPDDLRTFEARLVDGALDEVTSALASHTVTLSLPRWDIQTSTSLVDTLTALGMPSAFGDADFSGITGDRSLVLGAAVHQANITVDENGAEAAAATALGLAGSAAPTDILDVRADRPFLFALRDAPTGTVLFLGRVTDPTAYASLGGVDG